MTKELLLARKAQLEKDLAVQASEAQAAQAQIGEGQKRAVAARDMINALSGAKQDCEFWLGQFQLEEGKATNVEGTDGGPLPPEERLN